ncbi:O-antigen ligase family protein [Argonema galeatum]|uniref:O-antigen ligase family protein n=1 Tax=Argonema galeatum TaxID=2942762 RepID=UPI0020116578|nr:O-antigen ligase family protein [Argonema galeatum]MCL1467689.1 O-antigen ligase family protein [Argonema galeatum A003/A1]
MRPVIKNSVTTFLALISHNPFLWALVFQALMSAFWSGTPELTLRASAVLLGTHLFIVYLCNQYSWKELAGILRVSNLGVALLSLLLKPPVGEEWAGVLYSKNAFSGLMCLSAILWYLHAVYQPKGRWLSLGMTVLSFAFMKRAKSAGALVTSFILIAFSSYLRYVKRLNFQWAFTAVVLFLVISASLSILITDNLPLIVVDWLGKDLTFTGRTTIWAMIIPLANKRPVFGYGYVGFWQPWRGFDDPAHSVITDNEWRPPNSHNGFIEIYVQLGWIGLILFFLAFVTSLAMAVIYLIRSKKPDSVLPLILITYMFMRNLSESAIIDLSYTWFYYVLSTVRLSLDIAQKNFSDDRTKSQEAASLKPTEPSNRAGP